MNNSGIRYQTASGRIRLTRAIVNRARLASCLVGTLACAFCLMSAASAQTLPNTCPVDGCVVTITDIQPAGDELQVTFESNFTPDVSKNHFHVYWGDVFDIKQVGRSAETVHGVTQGRWHRHADFPTYTTTGAASTAVREGTTNVCVSASDRDHNILDVSLFHCVDASSHLQ